MIAIKEKVIALPSDLKTKLHGFSLEPFVYTPLECAEILR